MEDTRVNVDASFNDVTILLQGVLHKDISLSDILDSYTKYCHVILSIYDSDYDIAQQIAKKYENVTLVVNNVHDFKNALQERKLYSHSDYHNNCYYQIRTTLMGFTHVTTPYVVKSRVDHFYEGLDDFIRTGLKIKKLVSSSLYVRGYSMSSYHLSDCLFMGCTDHIQKGLVYAEKNYHETWPEVFIWKSYFTVFFQQFGLELHKLTKEQYYENMEKYVHIYSINNFPRFRIKVMREIMTSFDDRQKTTTEYLQRGCG